MDSKKDIKGMASKEDLQDLKEFIKDIKHNFIPQLSTQEDDKEGKGDLFQSCMEKIEKKWRVGSLSPQNLMIHYNIMGSIQVQETTLSPRLTCESLMASIQSCGFFIWSNSLIYTRCPLCKR